MKIQGRIILLLVLIMAIFAGVFSSFQRSENEKIRLIIEDNKIERSTAFDKLLELKGQSLESFAFDYTYWDDMVHFVKSPEKQWAVDNIESSIPHYKIDAVWIYDLNFSRIYSFNTAMDEDLNELPIPQEVRQVLFKQGGYFRHFFVNTSQGLMEIRSAPIQPTADKQRKTPPQGFFFTGRLWDKNYLNELSSLTDDSVQLLPAQKQEAIEVNYDSKRFVISFARILNDWNGAPLMKLDVERALPTAREFSHSTRKQFFLSILFACTVLGGLYFFLIQWIGIPLQRITESLNAQNPVLLRTLQSQETELGQIARLIRQFFEQKENLVKEVAERRRIEKMLRSSEERFKILFEFAPDAYYLMDIKGNFLDGNRAAEKMSGYRREELVGKNLFESSLLPSLEHKKDRDILEESGKWSPEQTQDFTIRRKDGTELNLEITTHSIKIKERDLVLGIARDVTERKQLEQQLFQSQKMEAIGRLAGGVAHDFNNLLTVISGYTEILAKEFLPGDEKSSQIQQIAQAAERAAKLTHQLLAFSRRHIVQLQVVNLNELILNMDKMLRRLIGEDIEIVTLPFQGESVVKADPAQIEQILINLAVNARDAMPKGGKIIIETGNMTFDETYSRKHPGVLPGEYVMLAVSDNGHGMSEDVQSHLFEPFFTTKEKGKGTGLGLATCYGMVRQVGGYIWIYSEVNKGTSVKIYLPRVKEEMAVSSQPEQSGREISGTETILLVEDEAMVRDLAIRILNANGYKVLFATNGEEAMRVVKESKSKTIHLLLTDVVMPQMGGRELAEQIREIYPRIKILFASGYTDESVIQHGILEKNMAFIQKPFTVDSLLKKTREVLDQTT